MKSSHANKKRRKTNNDYKRNTTGRLCKLTCKNKYNPLS